MSNIQRSFLSVIFFNKYMDLKGKILMAVGGIIIVIVILNGIGLESAGISRTSAPELWNNEGMQTGILPETSSDKGFGESEIGSENSLFGETSAETSAETSSRLIIKSGELSIVVSDITKSVKSIIQYAEDQEGWIVQSDIQDDETAPRGSVTVRVPAEKFDDAMAYVREIATEVSYEKSQGDDVTEEYVDLESELKNLEATEQQFLKIMEKAENVSEILEVQAQITIIRGKIEKTKGRMLYLERSSKMATISVNVALSEDLLPVPPAEKWRPEYVAKQVWKSVVEVWRNISYAVIKFFIWLVVWVPVLTVLYIIARVIGKIARGRKKNDQKE